MSKKKKRRFGGAREAAERRDSGANYGYIKIPKDIEMFIPETECSVVLDILPYEITDSDHMDKKEQGDAWFKRPVKVHKNIGVNKDAYVCPTTFGKACPICEERQDKIDDGGDWKDDDVKALKPSLRNLYAVKVLSYEGNKKKYDKKKIYLFDFSDYLFQEAFESQLKKKDAFDNFFDPENGTSIEITFDEETFGGNKYAKPTRFDFVKRKKQYSEDIVDDVPKLDEIFVVLSYDDLDAKLHGDVVDADEEKPKKDKKKKKKSKEEPAEEPKKKDKKKKKEKEAEPEEKPKKEKKKGKDKKEEKPKKKVKPGECPYDHKYGKDCDKFDDCVDCELWNECREAKDKKKKKKKK